jgi:hypothetical protein
MVQIYPGTRRKHPFITVDEFTTANTLICEMAGERKLLQGHLIPLTLLLNELAGYTLYVNAVHGMYATEHEHIATNGPFVPLQTLNDQLCKPATGSKIDFDKDANERIAVFILNLLLGHGNINELLFQRLLDTFTAFRYFRDISQGLYGTNDVSFASWPNKEEIFRLNFLHDQPEDAPAN